jgi:hypothetical protein
MCLLEYRHPSDSYDALVNGRQLSKAVLVIRGLTVRFNRRGIRAAIKLPYQISSRTRDLQSVPALPVTWADRMYCSRATRSPLAVRCAWTATLYSFTKHTSTSATLFLYTMHCTAGENVFGIGTGGVRMRIKIISFYSSNFPTDFS